MSFLRKQGTAFTGYLQLTNGAPGPANIPIRTSSGSAYTLQATERLYLTSIVMSSNDTANPLVQVDLGTGTFVVVSGYVGNSFPAYIDNFTEPPIVGKPGVLFRASAAAVTAGKTVEVKILGYVSQT